MQTVLGPALPRRAEAAVNAALEDTRVVLVNGARQSGKSTLVRLVAKGRNAEWRDLDTALTRQAALETLPFGPKMLAMPVSALWQTSTT